ncbi:hypothetical protein VTK56DRAFT_4709 [Thermocarpiscus australiensis]
MPSQPDQQTKRQDVSDTAMETETETETDLALPNEGDQDDNRDLDTDEIASMDSDELHETRPNRWKGNPDTWRTWTEKDRRTWTALVNARCQDLAVHLYNAYALKKRFRVGPDLGRGQQSESAEGGSEWYPGQLWTAWPMKADEVRDDELLPRTVDVNEQFTLRRNPSHSFAGSNLEEDISATILRCAKEKFLGRDLQRQARDQVAQSTEKRDDTDASDADASDTTGRTTAKDEEEADAPPRTPKRRRALASPSFTPVPSADDDLSYALLRPAARRIMAKLDDTLMILHNSRIAGLGDVSESSASDENDTDAEAPRRKRERQSEAPSRGTSRRGRPRKIHVPREGETEQEMLIRVAKESKRRMPTFSTDKTESEGDDNRSTSRSRVRGRRSGSATSRASPRPKRSRSRSSSASSEVYKEKRLAKWGLRDWRDVIGAAAMAGFSPAVIARAAQRCSTLFREEMTMHTLHEQPATSDKAAIETVRYVPGGPLPACSDEDDDDEEADGLFQLRTVSRHSSVRLESSPELEPEQPTSTSRRSRSATPGAVHLCSYPDCPRAIEGFPKRTNLARHLQTVHGKRAADFTEDEEDSIDEMEGGVHVDRFLRPIKVRKGWRRGDIQLRRRRRPRKRAGEDAGSEELDLDGRFLGVEGLLSD